MTTPELEALLAAVGRHDRLAADPARRSRVWPTTACVPIPRLAAGDRLSDDELGHVIGCAYCLAARAKLAAPAVPAEVDRAYRVRAVPPPEPGAVLMRGGPAPAARRTGPPTFRLDALPLPADVAERYYGRREPVSLRLTLVVDGTRLTARAEPAPTADMVVVVTLPDGTVVDLTVPAGAAVSPPSDAVPPSAVPAAGGWEATVELD